MPKAGTLDPYRGGAAYLQELGWSGLALRHHAEISEPAKREKALAWVWGLETARFTREGREVGGRNRGIRVKACGVWFPALCADGVIRLRRRPCRDRACPACMRDRAREYGWSLRRASEWRLWCPGRGPLLFVTLTQKKRGVRGEGAGEAVSRLLGSWSDLTSTRKAAGRRFRSRFAGGLRAVEITWAGRGKEIKGHRVQYTGWHAHAHCVLEGVPGAEPGSLAREIARAWTAVSPGSDPAGVNVQPLSVRGVGQIAKYISKPFEVPEDRARELFSALAGRRLIQGWGTYRDWRKFQPDEIERPKVEAWGECSVGKAAERWRKFEERGRGSAAPAYLFQRHFGPPEDQGTRANITPADLRRAIWRDSAAANERAEDAARKRLERKARRDARRDASPGA